MIEGTDGSLGVNMKRNIASVVLSSGLSASIILGFLGLSGPSHVAADYGYGAAYGPHDKVTLCREGHDISVSRNAESAQLATGASVGVCR